MVLLEIINHTKALCRGESREAERDGWKIWARATQTQFGRSRRREGRKGFCIQLNCAGEGECQNRERDRGENRSGKGGRGTREARKGDLSSMALSPESKTKMLCTSVKGFHVWRPQNFGIFLPFPLFIHKIDTFWPQIGCPFYPLPALDVMCGSPLAPFPPLLLCAFYSHIHLRMGRRRCPGYRTRGIWFSGEGNKATFRCGLGKRHAYHMELCTLLRK